MKQVLIQREKSEDTGTPGKVYIDGKLQCLSLELPWRNNQVKMSSIMPGTYPVLYVQSPKFGKVYGLRNTPGRSHVLIHSGNYAGDTTKGFKTHVEGCILLGSAMGVLSGQKAILNSRVALDAFCKAIGEDTFTLTVKDFQGV